MATIPQIRNRLLEGFPEPQADLLAHVFVESQDQLVTKAELNELTGVVKDLAVAQGRTEQRVGELVVAQGRTEQRVEELAVAQGRTEQRVEELALAQGRTEQRVEELALAQGRTEQRVEELAVAQGRTEQRVEELAVAQGRTEQRVEELVIAQGRTEKRVETLAVAQGTTEQSLWALTESHNQTQQELRGLTKTVQEFVAEQKQKRIRLDDSDGRTLELLLRTRLPAYLGPHMRKCRVITVEQILDTVEGRLTIEEIEDLLRIDILATAEVDGTLMHLAGEVSRTAHKQDVVRALRRAEHLRKAGLPTIAFVACDAITHKTAELASREKVRVLIKGRLLPETA